MKSWERLLAILVSIFAVGGGIQGALVLPYRVEQGEKAHAALLSDFNSEKTKWVETRESLIRIEEQLKSMSKTMDEIDRRQRTQSASHTL